MIFESKSDEGKRLQIKNSVEPKKGYRQEINYDFG